MHPVAAAMEYWPATHDAHTVAPIVDWNLPAAQLVHTVAFEVLE